MIADLEELVLCQCQIMSVVLAISPAIRFMMHSHYAVLGMVRAVEYDPHVVHIQRTFQEAQPSSTECVCTVVVLSYLLD